MQRLLVGIWRFANVVDFGVSVWKEDLEKNDSMMKPVYVGGKDVYRTNNTSDTLTFHFDFRFV